MTRNEKATTGKSKMSDARRKAAQENGRKSNGPRTIRGKINSSKNALKHGLNAATHVVIPGEDPAAFKGFVDAWYHDVQPAGMRHEPKAAPEMRPESGPEGPEKDREGPKTVPSGGADGFRPVV